MVRTRTVLVSAAVSYVLPVGVGDVCVCVPVYLCGCTSVYVALAGRQISSLFDKVQQQPAKVVERVSLLPAVVGESKIPDDMHEQNERAVCCPCPM